VFEEQEVYYFTKIFIGSNNLDDGSVIGLKYFKGGERYARIALPAIDKYEIEQALKQIP